MPVGKSNRIVVDLDLEKKRKLYAELARNGKTMKDWFEEQVDRYLEGRNSQMHLLLNEDDRTQDQR
jgi:hypothetical protein